MSKLERLPERMLDLASQAGDKISDLAPRASDWLDAGAKIGALKAASKIGVAVVRRNPIVFTAALAGAGLVWYAAHRRARRAEDGNGNGEAIEGSARRIDAKDGDAPKAKRRTTRAAGARRSTRATRETRTEH